MREDGAAVVFLGMDSVYSTRVLTALYNRGHNIIAAVKPMGGLQSRRRNILVRSTYFTGVAARAVSKITGTMTRHDPDETDPFHIAALHGTPCYTVGSVSKPRARGLLQKLEPDIICIAFFNQLLRKKVLAVPKLGTLNAHPSLLPAYRGPSPLFWMFKNGEKTGGVSVHMVDAGEDSGAVLYREESPMDIGITGPEYLDRLADIAARLMTRAVDDLVAGNAQSVVQDISAATRHARPTEEDLQVTFGQPAQEVFAMVRGLAQWAPLWASIDRERWRILEAVNYEPDTALGAEQVFTGDQIAIQCQPGVLIVRAKRIPPEIS